LRAGGDQGVCRGTNSIAVTARPRNQPNSRRFFAQRGTLSRFAD
jgi:hypothetical protein